MLVFVALTLINGVILAMKSTGMWPFGSAARLFYAAIVTSCVVHLAIVGVVAAIIVALLRHLSPTRDWEWRDIVLVMGQAHWILVAWAWGLTAWLMLVSPSDTRISREFVAVVAVSKFVAFGAAVALLVAILRRAGQLRWTTAVIVTVIPIASLAALGWIGSQLLTN